MSKVSIIIPVYNAEMKIEKAINSILNQTMTIDDIEVLFINDKSTDSTEKIIKRYCQFYSNFRLINLEKNSGSPSRPRNIGIKEAKSEYIIFLDADDRLLESTCQILYSEIHFNDLDIVRGYLKVIKEEKTFFANKLTYQDYAYTTTKQLINNLVTKQSTTIDGIYRKMYLLENQIQFNENIKIGEDTLFLSKCYTNSDRIKYIKECVYEYNKRNEINNVSSTQSYTTKELNDHLYVWNEVQKTFKKINVDYLKLRLRVGLRAAFQSMINYSDNNISHEDFQKLRSFLIENRNIVNDFKYNDRIMEVLENIKKNDFNSFRKNLRKRLLINGYDLKFIKPLIPYFEKKYEVSVDEWTGHNIHDEKKSQELLKWADIIFSEWLLGNAVWYSKNKLPHQIMYVRMHKFELYRDFGHEINMNNVDCFISVALYTYEKFIEQFKIPREKMKIIPNFVECNRFDKNKNEDVRYNLAMIGILPSMKRVDLGINILEKLLDMDSKFKLFIIGKKPEEVTWLWKMDEERLYYEKVYKRISEDEKLRNNIVFLGWQDTAEALQNMGYVLSVSDKDKPESFHLAPAEGMASGSIGLILDWPGVEYIYPREFIYDSPQDMVERIITIYKDKEEYEMLSKKGKKFIYDNYDINLIVEEIDLLIRRSYLLKN